MKNKKIIAGIILCIFILLMFIDKITGFLINLKWFIEVGYLSVYLKRVLAVFKLMVPIFAICFMSIWFYFKSIKKSIVKYEVISEVNSLKGKKQKRIFFLLDFVISLFISFNFSNSYWYKILQFTSSTDFNVKDPIFNIDISFFIFKLPLIESLYEIGMFLIVFLAAVTVVVYFILVTRDKFKFGKQNLSGFFKISDFKSGITKFAGKQLAILGGLILIFISINYAIKAWNLVYSPRGVAFGASYTDTKISLKFYIAIIAISLVCSIVVFISILKSKVKPIIISVILIVVLIFSESAVSSIWQKFVVKSNEKRLETPFIEYNMKYTKMAFGIDKVKERVYPLKNNLNKDIIDKNKTIIENIKINSVSPALEFYNQVESKKNYYTFNDIDIDRYNINGKYTQVFIAAREIDYDKLQGKANTWQNKHLTYTHGYGIVMSKVNSVTTEGKPDFTIKDMPINNKSGIRIDDPRIYFGEKSKEYAIVNTNINEMNYPKESGENATENYNGISGIKMNFFNRILFAINKRDIKFLLSNDITSDSRILINRNILARVKKIAPFLAYDKDPYMIINNGKLYWILDAYTVSDRYPFSEPINKINYMRNSVKVIIDAVDGTTNFYLIDNNDPVAVTYSKIFTKLFKTEIPKGFKEHFRYPQDYFITQCKVMEKYHVNSASSFFSAQNLWEVSQTQKGVQDKNQLNEASYVIMKLPGENKEEMVLLQYFNQNQRENMVALFSARMDNDNYGSLTLYKFPTTENETVNSPILFKQKIKQDTVISKELSLWDDKGSEVKFGDTMIVPIENSLLYIEPIYLRAEGEKSIPEMKRVVVSYGENMVLAQNIDDALKQLFNYEDVKDDDVNQDKNTNSNKDKTINHKEAIYIKQAKELYNKAIQSQKNGEWSKYGEYINQLGNILNKLND